MGSVFDIIKRLGAVLVVLILIVMMGLIFSSQPIEEITRVVTGASSIGKFAGKSIPPRYYALYENGCREWIAERKLEQQKFFLEHCINTRLRQVYVLSRVGERLGVKASPEGIKQEILEQARKEHERQTDLNPEDRFSMNEIYRYNLNRLPLDLRVRQKMTGDVYNILTLPFLESPAKKAIETAAKKTTLRLRIIYYNDRTLTDQVKSRIETPESALPANLRKELKEQQARELQKKGKAATPSPKEAPLGQKKNILERLKSTRVTKEVTAIKSRLRILNKANKKYSLEDVAQATGITPLDLGRVRLSDMGSVAVDKQAFDLMQKEFLLQLKTASAKKAIGPIKSGPYKVYVEISQLRYPGISVSKVKNQPIPEEAASNDSLANEFLTYIMEEESRRGAFSLRHPGQEDQTKAQ